MAPHGPRARRGARLRPVRRAPPRPGPRRPGRPLRRRRRCSRPGAGAPSSSARESCARCSKRPPTPWCAAACSRRSMPGIVSVCRQLRFGAGSSSTPARRSAWPSRWPASCCATGPASRASTPRRTCCQRCAGDCVDGCSRRRRPGASCDYYPRPEEPAPEASPLVARLDVLRGGSLRPTRAPHLRARLRGPIAARPRPRGPQRPLDPPGRAAAASRCVTSSRTRSCSFGQRLVTPVRSESDGEESPLPLRRPRPGVVQPALCCSCCSSR